MAEEEQTPLRSQPESIHPAVSFWQREWRVIKSWSFWIAVALVGIGLFFVMQWHYSIVLAEKDATMVALAADRDHYKGMSESPKKESQNDAPIHAAAPVEMTGADGLPGANTGFLQLEQHPILDISTNWELFLANEPVDYGAGCYRSFCSNDFAYTVIFYEEGLRISPYLNGWRFRSEVLYNVSKLALNPTAQGQAVFTNWLNKFVDIDLKGVSTNSSSANNRSGEISDSIEALELSKGKLPRCLIPCVKEAQERAIKIRETIHEP
jgi:hypothetical protein